MTRRLGAPGGLLLLFGLASLAAVVAGAEVCAASGVPATLWTRNLAAWGVGAVAAVAIAAAWRPGGAQVALWAAPVGLIASLLSPGQDGVHRWVALGPVQANVAMLLLPATIVALAALAAARKRSWIAVLLSLSLLAAQPDASQATALAAAAALVAAVAVPRPVMRGVLGTAAGLLAAVAWLRPDPLQPVPAVEGIVGLTWGLSPIAAVAALVLLAVVAAAPAVSTLSGAPGPRLAGWALSLCFAVWAVAPFLGAFPVPFVGLGMSPIVGAWLGAGLLAGLLRTPAAAEDAPGAHAAEPGLSLTS